MFHVGVVDYGEGEGGQAVRAIEYLLAIKCLRSTFGSNARRTRLLVMDK